MISYENEMSKASFWHLVPKRCLATRLLLMLFLIEMGKHTCHLDLLFSRHPLNL